MGFIALGSFNFLKQDSRESLALIIAIGVGAIVYGVLVYFMRIPEVERTLELVKTKVRGRVGEKSE